MIYTFGRAMSWLFVVAGIAFLALHLVCLAFVPGWWERTHVQLSGFFAGIGVSYGLYDLMKKGKGQS